MTATMIGLMATAGVLDQMISKRLTHLASESKVKEQGTYEAFVNCGVETDIFTHNIQVGPPQPNGWAEIWETCFRRFNELHSITEHVPADFYVAIESGKVQDPFMYGEMDVTVAIASARTKPDFVSRGVGGGFLLPQSVLNQLVEKKELGLCDVEGRPIDKKRGGMIDVISGGALKREHCIEMAVRSALIPLLTDVRYP